MDERPRKAIGATNRRCRPPESSPCGLEPGRTRGGGRCLGRSHRPTGARPSTSRRALARHVCGLVCGSTRFPRLGRTAGGIGSDGCPAAEPAGCTACNRPENASRPPRGGQFSQAKQQAPPVEHPRLTYWGRPGTVPTRWGATFNGASSSSCRLALSIEGKACFIPA